LTIKGQGQKIRSDQRGPGECRRDTTRGIKGLEKGRTETVLSQIAPGGESKRKKEGVPGPERPVALLWKGKRELWGEKNGPEESRESGEK